jgi:hypothetical protein
MINYEQDFYGWTQEQAALLRAGQLNDLDITNLIEEIETMGRSEKRELQSRIIVLLVHLLKWRYQSQRRGRSWALTIDSQRLHLDDVLKDNPGLRPQLPDIFSNAYRLARADALKETQLDKDIFPLECPWTLDQIREDGFYPD